MAKTTARRPFEEVFQEALDQIYEDARVANVALIDLAEEVGISRAQFSRWKRQSPATVRAMTKLQAAIGAKLKK